MDTAIKEDDFVARATQYAITKLIELKVVDLKVGNLVLPSEGWASLERILHLFSKSNRTIHFPIALWNVEIPNVKGRCYFFPSERCYDLIDQTCFLRIWDKNTVHVRFEVNHYELSQVKNSIVKSNFAEFLSSKLSQTSFSGKLNLYLVLLYCISFIITIDEIRFCKKTKIR